MNYIDYLSRNELQGCDADFIPEEPIETAPVGAGELGVWIPLFMITELKLCGTPLLVYALIYSFTSSGKEYWGSRDYLAKRSGCSVSTVDRALRKLEKMGLINARQKAYGRNIYVALPRDSFGSKCPSI